MNRLQSIAMGEQRLKHLSRFYQILDDLEEVISIPRTLAECSGRIPWPKRGVYFFREIGEVRTESGSGQRIVRVGTHALKSESKTSLWKRLSQHKGTSKTGGGSHRGSIFRLIVGTALLNSEDHTHSTWGKGNSAPREVRAHELILEQRVSSTIGAMPFLWLAIEDEPGPDSLRGYIERNSIALLSNFEGEQIDQPSTNWLGHKCNRQRIRQSGMWNSNHVHEDYDPVFLDALEELVEDMRAAK